jgi:stage V sporulation protein S
MDIIKVSGNSRTSAVAGAIAGVFREEQHADVQAIGAGAVNQAVKALVLATGYLAEDGYDVVCVPEFVDVEIDGKTRTAVRLVVQTRALDSAPPERSEEPEDEVVMEPEGDAEPEDPFEARGHAIRNDLYNTTEPSESDRYYRNSLKSED